ncbi:hypothetical protein UFOVP116_287 [uncultured Caudovirales phage]|uniref:Uncharacterized protein n=1 Tax=uncultured Caudovirales phage TaxID=2100421 RepID=A0A6J5L7Z9_9CAUD|nr:hypothetical protein UFOVP116_287 [uncultured Caudovirales phage]
MQVEKTIEFQFSFSELELFVKEIIELFNFESFKYIG